ncbi:MAG TPA: aspartyl protease family protein [Acidobacteriota bacterium]|nr:aspartyl protease family protein [Acidobacteriota bacterium]
MAQKGGWMAVFGKVLQWAVLAAAVISAPWAAASPVALQQPIEVPAQADGNKISVQIQLDGSDPIWVVLDSGAPPPIVLLSDDRLPREMGWTSTAQFPLGGAGSGPRPMVDVFAGVSVKVAGLEFPDQRVLALPQGNSFASHTAATGWEGVIGGLLFNRFVVEQDYARGRIVLHPRDGFQAPQGATELPLAVGPAGHVFVDTQLRLQEGPLKPVRLVVDSGAGHALSLQSDEEQGILPPEKTVEAYLGSGVSGELHGKVGRLSELHLGEHVLRDVVTSFPEAGNMPNVGRRNGNLGMGVLRRFVVYFDIPGRRMFLLPGTDYREPFEFTATGLLVRRHSDGYEVVQVLDGSPAAQAGITKGALLTAVDGQATSSMRQDDLNDAMRQPNTTLSVTFRQDGREQPVTLTTRKIL